MMRWIALGVLVIALSAGATFLAGQVKIGDVPSPADFPAAESAGPAGKAVLDGDPVHDFGTMAQDTDGEKTWTVRNDGPGDLILRKGTSTCSCTIANLADGETATLKPGAETKIRLTWETRKNRDAFEKSAAILTSDPQRPEIRLVTKGIVRPAIDLTPEDGVLNFDTVPSDAVRKLYVAMASADKPDFKVLGFKISNPELIEAKTIELTPDDRKSLGYGPGYKLEVQVKPGKVLGNFSEEVLVQTDHPRKKEIFLKAYGRVLGPISVVPERLRGLNIEGASGGEVTASIWVRGQDSTKFEVASAPEKLKVAVEPADVRFLSAVKGRQYRMTVTAPPGTTSGMINGLIVLKTDHPGAATVSVPIDLLVR